MLNTINSDLIRGNIDTIILKALSGGDRYGYDIIKEIEQKSNGQYRLKQPTLYSCLKRLEAQNFIRSYWGARTGGGRRKYYTLTELGCEIFAHSQNEWEFSRTVIDKLISDREFSFSNLEALDSYAEAQDMETIDEIEESEAEIAEITDSVDTEKTNTEIADAETATTTAHLDIQANEASLNLEKNEPMSDTVEHIFHVTENDTLTAIQENNVIADTQEDKSEIFFRSSSDLFKSLMEEASLGNSYSDKLTTDEYNAVLRPSSLKSNNSNNYFQDFTDDEAYDNEEDEQIELQSQSVPSQPQLEQAQTKKNTVDSFMKYSASMYEQPKNDDKRILEREYKSLLGRMLEGQSLELNNLTPALKQDQKLPKVESEPPKSATAIAREAELSKSLTRIAGTARETTGDNLRARIHDNRADAIFRKKYHYYSNKLMLAHYGILFLFMLAMTVITFLTAYRYFNILRNFDKILYIGSIILALIFPLTSAVINYINPEKKKRCDFEFRNAFTFKMVVCILIILITYCVNIYFGMPFTLDAQYTASLLLPSLYALCLPLSTIIFYTLYVSGKFNLR